MRNDNSSRFGKYIELKFAISSERDTNSFGRKGGLDKDHHSSSGATLVAASIETYLLEKVRLVHQSPGERNYHIFYEIFSLQDDECDDHHRYEHLFSSGEELHNKIGLDNYDMVDFSLINASATYDRRDGVSDAATFRDTVRAMSIMGFRPEELEHVLGVTCALLHCSNLTFRSIAEGVECALESSDHLGHALNLLGITEEGLNRALCYYEIVVRGETHKKVLNEGQARKGVEALIKATYGAMFGYLVERINALVAGEGGDVPPGRKGGKKTRQDDASIGILVSYTLMRDVSIETLILLLLPSCTTY